MAAIQDDSKFKIKVTPEYTNWWTFKFEFFYENKPLFNPEISNAGIFEADEYDSQPFLPVLEKAIEGKTGGEHFEWGAWEEEVEVDIAAPNPFNLGGYFDFIVSVAEHCFKNVQHHGLQRICVKLYVEREELKKFYNDLKLEMVAVVHSLTPPREIGGSQPVENTTTVKVSDININTPRKHEKMPAQLVERISGFKEILAEVETMPLQVAIDNFCKDTNPEKEIEIWESIARLYKESISNNPNMTLEEKRKVYSGLLSRLMETTPISLEEK